LEQEDDMKTMPGWRRKGIEMQGFTGLGDAELVEVAPWVRLAPAVLLVWTATAAAAGSAVALWVLVPFAAAGAVLPTHPFDLVYDRALRRLLGTRPIPRYGAPRRFSWMLAAAWLAATALAFGTGVTTVGRALAFTLVAGATTTVTTDFCPGSWIHGRLFRRPRSAARPRAACQA
jgi:hypothetical protein